MEVNEVVESINLCVTTYAKGCDGCRYKGDVRCAVSMMKDAVKAMEAQQQRIAELEAELKAEMYRHDRYVDFELAEAEELRQVKEDLRLAMVQLRTHGGCECCIYEPLMADEYPCNGCVHCAKAHREGAIDNNWEWAKPEVDHEN